MAKLSPVRYQQPTTNHNPKARSAVGVLMCRWGSAELISGFQGSSPCAHRALVCHGAAINALGNDAPDLFSGEGGPRGRVPAHGVARR
jgi:hypothetical protein